MEKKGVLTSRSCQFAPPHPSFAYNTIMYTLLRRTDAVEHIDRWYMVAVQPSLLDKTAVICAYGNRQTEWQQLYVIPADSPEAARAQAETIVEQKLRRGYHLIP